MIIMKYEATSAFTKMELELQSALVIKCKPPKKDFIQLLYTCICNHMHSMCIFYLNAVKCFLHKEISKLTTKRCLKEPETDFRIKL